MPHGRRIVSAEVGALVMRHAHEIGEGHHPKLRRDTWEIILPEIVLERFSGSSR